MDGKIKVKSKKGQGTAIFVRLPMQADGGNIIGAETAATLQSMEINAVAKMTMLEYVLLPHGRVLVVDDVESNIHVIKGYLQPYKLFVDSADSGITAIEKIKAGNDYDIIFMDHMMPLMDGLEATKALRSMGYEKPIVALTANTIKGVETLFIQNGFTSFISKPIDLNQLDKTIKKFIQEKSLDAETAAALMPQEKTEAEINMETEFSKAAYRDVKKAHGELLTLLPVGVFNEEMYKTLILNAHSMKSVMFNINLNELSADAMVLEDAGKQKDDSIICANLPKFVEKLSEYIEQHSESEAVQAKQKADVKEDFEAVKAEFMSFVEACGTYSFGRAKRILKAIKNSPLSQKTSELYDRVDLMVLHGELEEAAELVVEYYKNV